MKIIFCAVFFFLSVFSVKAQTETVKSAREHILEREKSEKNIPNIVKPGKIKPLKDSAVIQNSDAEKISPKEKKCFFRRKNKKKM